VLEYTTSINNNGDKRAGRERRFLRLISFTINRSFSAPSLSSSAHVALQRLQEQRRGGAEPHLSEHGWEVPHAAHDGPAAHHAQQVAHHAVLAAVPEGVAEAGVVLRGREDIKHSVSQCKGGQCSRYARLKSLYDTNLDGYRVDFGADLKAALLEHHD